MDAVFVPILAPDEALAGYLARTAQGLFTTPHRLVQALGCGSLIQQRCVNPVQVRAISTFTGLAPGAVRTATLMRYPDSVTGHLRTNYVSGAPLGWASTRYSSRCVECHREGRPWLIQHQTALAVACTEHLRYLTTACGACAARTRMFTKPDLTCPHIPAGPPGDDAGGDDLTLQERRLHLLERSTQDPSAARWLQTLRAVTALLWIDATLVGRSAALSDEAVAAARRHTRQMQPRGAARPRHRLHRPPDSPALNAHLFRAAAQHLRTNGTFDDTWAERVIADARDSGIGDDQVTPFAGALGFDTPPRKPVPPPIHHAWLRRATRITDTLLAHGWSATNIPGALKAPAETLATDWSTPLARATLLVHLLSGEALTSCVRGLNHHFTHVTRVRRVLTPKPTAEDLDRLDLAAETLLASPPQDLRALSVAQRSVVRVPSATLCHLQTAMPASRSVHSSTVAALWLWCTVTGSHPVTAPFVDGRAAATVTSSLAEWDARARPEDKVLLLDWNDAETTTIVPGPEAVRPRARSLTG